MGSTKEEMKPCTDKVKTVDAADMVSKKGGLLSRIRDGLKKVSPQKTAKNFADLVEDFAELLESAIQKADYQTFVTDTKLILTQIDLRLQDMIVNKRKELKGESGREEYNQRAIARLMTIDWQFQSIHQIINRQSAGQITPVMLLEYIDWHVQEIGRLIVEYTDDK